MLLKFLHKRSFIGALALLFLGNLFGCKSGGNSKAQKSAAVYHYEIDTVHGASRSPSILLPVFYKDSVPLDQFNRDCKSWINTRSTIYGKRRGAKNGSQTISFKILQLDSLLASIKIEDDYFIEGIAEPQKEVLFLCYEMREGQKLENISSFISDQVRDSLESELKNWIDQRCDLSPDYWESKKPWHGISSDSLFFFIPKSYIQNCRAEDLFLSFPLPPKEL